MLVAVDSDECRFKTYWFSKTTLSTRKLTEIIRWLLCTADVVVCWF